jgi:diguanylate cyclase (GGDEF)-like protein
MSWISRATTALLADNDALAPFRPRIARHLSMLAVVILLPFTVNHLVQGRVGLGLAILLAQAVLTLNAHSLRAGRKAPVPFGLMMVTLIAAVLVSAQVQPAHGMLWAYPTLFIAYFVLTRRVALVLSLVLTVGVTLLTVDTLGPPAAARVGATLALTLVMINVVLSVIGDLQGALVQQTITDPLTGAYNRRHLHEQLDRSDLGGRPNQAWAMLAIDIDHFKQINDRFGHAVGDDVLRRVVELVRQRKRKSDLLFRTGGEEFVLLLPDTAQADATRVADLIRARIAETPMLPDGRPVTVSLGVSLRRSGQAADAWMREADNALYDAKRGGRNKVVLATV